jgi:hypothetical protein
MLLSAIGAHGLWVPWISPSFGAKYLLTDDGKNPLNDSRDAALYWGRDIYVPLSQRTSGFENISWIASNTLLDILETDPSPPDWLYRELEQTTNPYAQILYCYSRLRNGATAQDTNCSGRLENAVGSSDDGEQFLAQKALEKLEPSEG